MEVNEKYNAIHQDMSENVIKVWLKYLGLPQYFDSFIDNGYDDMETVKRVKKEDLDAIGVDDIHHQKYLLKAAKELRENGAAWVYLLYNENIEDSEKTNCDESENCISGSSGPESCRSSIPPSSDETYSDESMSIGKCYSFISGKKYFIVSKIKKILNCRPTSRRKIWQKMES